MGAKVNGRVQLITQAEYARRRQVAKSAVAKAVKEGRITLIDGQIDPAVADIQWAQNTRARGDSGRSTTQSPAAMGGAASVQEVDPGASDASSAAAQPVDDYQSLRTRRERAAVESAERENGREAGRLLDREATSRGVFDAFRALRDAVMASPQRAAARVVGLADVRDIERIITEELRHGFETAEQSLNTLVAPKVEGIT